MSLRWPRRWIWLWRGLLLLAVVLVVLDRCFPPPIPDPFHGAATVVLARNGTPLRAFADERGVWRELVNEQQSFAS